MTEILFSSSFYEARLNFVRQAHCKKKYKQDIFSCSSVKKQLEGFPGGTVVKNPPANVGDTGLSPGPGRSHMPRSN